MKKILAFQGSPRPNGNTAQLVSRILEGAHDTGAETEMVQTGSLRMSGCKGCYACKKKGNSFGRCVLRDDMTSLYGKIEKADAVVFGSPVYMCAMTPELKMVIDRLFPYLTMNLGSILPKGKKSALVFTQNQPDAALFEWHFNMTAFMLNTLGFGKSEIMLSVDTIGYNDKDISLLAGDGIDEIHAHKLERRKAEWNRDLEKAYELGRRLAGNA